MKAANLRQGMRVRATRTMDLAGSHEGLRVPRGRLLTVKRVDNGQAVVMFHGQELLLNPRDLKPMN